MKEAALVKFYVIVNWFVYVYQFSNYFTVMFGLSIYLSINLLTFLSVALILGGSKQIVEPSRQSWVVCFFQRLGVSNKFFPVCSGPNQLFRAFSRSE